MQTVSRRLRSAGIIVDPSKVVVEIKAREAARADLDARIDLGLRPKHLETLWMLRRVLEATPPARTVGKLREDAVAAHLPLLSVYYATDRHSMIFIDEAREDQPSLELAVAGQLVYVHYDQTPGGLAEALYEPQGLLDGIRVRKCLLEGHARLAQMLIEHTALDTLDAEALAGLDPAPQHLHATLTEQLCGAGARYLYDRYREGSWDLVLKSARTPPPSTEQLMHAAKVGKDFPANVALPGWPDPDDNPAAPIGDAKQTYEDVLGELTIHRLLLERGVDPTQAYLAAVGWDGDKLRIYERPSGELVMIWRSVWDREQDAEQFAAAIAPKGIEPRAFRVERHGRVVDAVSTDLPETASALHAALAKRPGEPTPQPSDAASTSAIEARVGG